VLLIARRVDIVGLFEFHPLRLNAETRLLLSKLSIDDDSRWIYMDPHRPRQRGRAAGGLSKVLAAFDGAAGKWFRPPDDQPFGKMVGIRGERLLGMRGESNSPLADLEGVELKAMLASRAKGLSGQAWADLLLISPSWTHGLTASQVLKKYGYPDAKRRLALKIAISSKTNRLGWSLRVRRAGEVLELVCKGGVVGFWTRSMLSARLREKLRTTIFALASDRYRRSRREFAFHTLILAEGPSAVQLLALIRDGEAEVQLRQHTGRNRGIQFRVRIRSLTKLFATVREVRAYRPGT
jgi:hypothetical protein